MSCIQTVVHISRVQYQVRCVVIVSSIIIDIVYRSHIIQQYTSFYSRYWDDIAFVLDSLFCKSRPIKYDDDSVTMMVSGMIHKKSDSQRKHKCQLG